MSAADRAKARREAILKRGQDRLAKLTTSARGEDHPAYRDDLAIPKASAADRFTGEDDSGPVRLASASPAPSRIPSGQTPPPQMPEQSDFFQALMQSAMSGVPPDQMPSFGGAQNPLLNDPNANADPFAQVLAQLTRQMPQGGGPNAAAAAQGPAEQSRPKTLLEKIMPLIHLIGAWSLLAYFAIMKEPVTYEEDKLHVWKLSWWQRWAELQLNKSAGGFSLASLPNFVWAFMTLLLVLHSMRIVTKTAKVQLPGFLTMILVQLPPPYLSFATNIMSVLKFGSALLDDVAALIVGIGFLVCIASWFS